MLRAIVGGSPTDNTVTTTTRDIIEVGMPTKAGFVFFSAAIWAIHERKNTVMMWRGIRGLYCKKIHWFASFSFRRFVYSP